MLPKTPPNRLTPKIARLMEIKNMDRIQRALLHAKQGLANPQFAKDQCAEIVEALQGLQPADVHALMLRLIDERMDEDGRSPERTRELRALADGCHAYEQVAVELDRSV